jgi:hypothetical protein
MKAAPYDKAIEAAYKKKRNQVVTLTRRAKRELKNKIRPGVEKNIKEQIKKQVEDKGAAAVSREVELTAQTILSNANSGRNTPNVRHQSGGHGNPTHLTERLHPGNINVPQGGGYHIRSHSNPQMAHLHPMSQTQRLSNPGSGHSSPSRFNTNVHRQPIGPPNTSSYQGGQAFSRGSDNHAFGVESVSHKYNEKESDINNFWFKNAKSQNNLTNVSPLAKNSNTFFKCSDFPSVNNSFDDAGNWNNQFNNNIVVPKVQNEKLFFNQARQNNQQRFQQPKNNNNNSKNQQVQVPTVQLAPPQTGTGVTKTGSWSAMLKK